MRDRMRGEWGFEGMIISDAGAVDGVWGCDKTNPVLHDRACHNYTHSTLNATAVALNAGCDLNYGSAYAGNLQAAVDGGSVTLADVTTSVKNVFRPRLQTMIEPALTDPSTIPDGHKSYTQIPFSVVDSQEHRQLARDAAASSAVLMTNHDQTLPLPLTAGKTITVAVIGEHTGGDGAAGVGSWTEPISDGCYHFNVTDPAECTPFWQVVPGEILGGAYRGTPSHIDSILSSFQKRAVTGGVSLKVLHALGVKTGCKAPACNGASCPAFNASCSSRHGKLACGMLHIMWLCNA